MDNKKIRVRYAPSPTGLLHIGGARSALYNYLFAKHHGGQFILRSEDTDIERNIERGEDSQLDGLAWLGIFPDESPRQPNPKYAPYRQTERLKQYQEWAEWLVEKGHAYYCYCTNEELESDREAQLNRGIPSPRYNLKCHHASKEEIEKYQKEGRKPCIRLHLEESKEIKFTDLVRGEVSFNNDDMGDWVILKSNGIPTYNFGVVIDDHFMDISHVFRGEEHLSNTPKQIQLFNYFGWDVPKYGHMTLITNEEGKKLSKRDPSIVQFIEQYQEMGYLPEAIFNFILLLGWSPNELKEIFTKEEAIAAFDEKRLSKSPSMFDVQKLKWINNQYIKAASLESIIELCLPRLEKHYDLSNKSKQWISDLVALFKDQLVCADDIVPLAKILFDYELSISEEGQSIIKEATSIPLIEHFINNLPVKLDSEEIKLYLKSVQTTLGIKGKALYMPLRIAFTGHEHGPDLTTIIRLLGEKEIKARYQKFQELVG